MEAEGYQQEQLRWQGTGSHVTYAPTEEEVVFDPTQPEDRIRI